MERQEEAIVPLPGPRAKIRPTTAYRSTWVVSSLDALRSFGHFERYLDAVREHRDEILSCVAGTWLPMPVVSAHYRACDTLALSEDEITEMVRGPGARVRRAWHSRLIAAADQAKEDPWTVLPQLDRAWRRGANGGAAAVFRLGPKEARVEYVRCELFRIPYYCQAVRAVLLMLVEHFGAGSAVRMLRQPATDEGHYLLHWV
jgi:hypothetical protein